jgi:hypothetical protein
MMALADWSGWPFLTRLFDSRLLGSGEMLSMYTGGRFGSSSTTAPLWETAARTAPLQGLGLGAYSPLDNSYLEFFYQGGGIALLLYAAFLVFLAFVVFGAASRGSAEGKLLAMLWVLVVVEGFGAPVLTINRTSLLLWVVLMLALHSLAPHGGRREEARA